VAEATVYLENRQMQSRPGFFVVTPLQLDDGTAVLVQRGWQPRDLMDRTRVVPPPTPAGLVQVSGRIAPPPARLYEFEGQAQGPIRQNLDVQAFGQEWRLRLRPLSLLQLDEQLDGQLNGQLKKPSPNAAPSSAPDGLLRDWLAPASGVHKHYGYAFQWFALAALILGLYVWFQLIRPRRRH
jgi:surfeit locus 1 family protein